MKTPRFIVHGFSRDIAQAREGERSWGIWWAEHRCWVPANAWAALGAATAAAVGFVLVGPLEDPSRFYLIASQIVPAFLIALAVERSLLDSLGTKSDFARARRDETRDSYTASGLNEGVRNTVEFALLERQAMAWKDGGRALQSVPVEPLHVAQAAAMGHWDDDRLTWKIFRDLLHEEFGLQADDPDFFDPPEEWHDPSPAFDALRQSTLGPVPSQTIRLLAARAALRDDRSFSGGAVGNQLVGEELRRLFAAQHESEFDSVLKRVTYRANREYDRQRKLRTVSLRTSIVLLTTTEFVALVGLMSPGQPYSCLFVIAAALVTGSIMNVAGGALADLRNSGVP